MKILAKVFAKGEMMCGTSANGEWERQTLVVETLADNPKRFPVDFFGKKKTKKLQTITTDDYVEVIFEIEGREHEGRWFAQINGIDCTPFHRVDVSPSNNE